MGMLLKNIPPPPIQPVNTIDQTLAERGENYGVFANQAEIVQRLKANMQMTKGWGRLQADQKEALEMIAHKVARILNGNPDYADSWVDISGYAQLVGNRLLGKGPQ